MKRVQLTKSKDWIERNFEGLRELQGTTKPISFRPDSIAEDTRRIAQEFNGRMTGKNGREIVVVTSVHPQMPELLLFEFIDEKRKTQVGTLTLLFIPKVRELSVGFFDLTEVRGNGIGREFAQRFRSFIPEGIGLTFGIEEALTKRFLVSKLETLMANSQLTDWRPGSSQRPAIGPEKIHALPAHDQILFEQKLLAEHKSQMSPIFQLLKTFQTHFEKLRVGLSQKGDWIFEAVALT